ncbi:MAG TPA: hypothetical protein VGP53_10135, partial [Acidimicrobiales bacterium]|nr:hypothetical protein [Acidimicrobiales bacterium]
MTGPLNGMRSTSPPTPLLVVTSSSVAGGAERALASLVRFLPELGFAPHAALFERGPLEGWLAEVGCPCHLVPFGRLRHPSDVARTVVALRRLARRVDAGLILDNLNTAHIYG